MGNAADKAAPLEDGDEFVDASIDFAPPKLYKWSGSSSSPGLPPKFVLIGPSTTWKFEKEEVDEESDADEPKKVYVMVITYPPKRLKAEVSTRLSMKWNDDKLRGDFVVANCNDRDSDGIWAIRFSSGEEYQDFATQFRNCLFENTHGVPQTKANMEKVMGKEYLSWATGPRDDEDDEMWDAEDKFEEPNMDLLENLDFIKKAYEQEKTPVRGITGFTMGAGDNSYLLHGVGMNVYRNTHEGVQSKNIAIRLDSPGASGALFETPKKGVLLRGETNMMLLSPHVGQINAGAVRQLDIETGKVVKNWEFQKDGVAITMRDIVNDSKGDQLENSSSFMGLDDNRLCRWDARDKDGVVLTWDDGHQFARGTNFRCMATTGDGSVVVGSRDGKVRLYSTSSLRQAKTVFPGVGFPITAVDVTFDGKWVLATTDSCLIVICTLFKDASEREKTGFQGKGGSKLAPPRLLMLTPQHAYLAGERVMKHGRFSWVTEGGQQERNLVVSVGKYSVVWSFARVKQSSNHNCYETTKEGLKSCYCYKVVQNDGFVVDSSFMHQSYVSSTSPEAPLVIATPSDLSTFNVGRG